MMSSRRRCNARLRALMDQVLSVFEIFGEAKAWISLATLSALEIVLGIDNIVFLSILTGKLPRAQQPKARRLGLAGALLMRIGLLFGLSIIAGMKADVFALLGHGFSGRDLVLIVGGLFLVAKATFEIHDKVEH